MFYPVTSTIARRSLFDYGDDQRAREGWITVSDVR